jgi:ATP-dependent Lhr-like helicase
VVVLVDGFLAAYVRRGERELLLFAPEDEPQRSRLIRAAARALAELSAPRGMFLSEIDGAPATTHRAVPLFVESGFLTTAMGLQRRPVPGRRVQANPEPEHEPGTENLEG